MCNQADIKLRDLPSFASQVIKIKGVCHHTSSKYLLLYIFYSCVYVHGNVMLVPLCAYGSKRRMSAGGFPLSLSTLFFETGSLTESKSSPFQLNSLATKFSGSSCLHIQFLGLQAKHGHAQLSQRCQRPRIKSSFLHSQVLLATEPYLTPHNQLYFVAFALLGFKKVETSSKSNCSDLNRALRNVRHSLPSPTLNTHTLKLLIHRILGCQKK